MQAKINMEEDKCNFSVLKIGSRMTYIAVRLVMFQASYGTLLVTKINAPFRHIQNLSTAKLRKDKQKMLT